MRHLIDKLVVLKDKSNMTDLEFELLTGLNNATYHNWKSGKHLPRLFEFQTALNALGYGLMIAPTRRNRKKQSSNHRSIK